MDEPPRDNNNTLGLLTVVAFLLLGADCADEECVRSFEKHRRTDRPFRDRIICFLRNIHSPLGSAHMLI